MIHYLIQAKILDPELFGAYIKGHLPTIAQYGGEIVFRSVENETVHGDGRWDAVAIQRWPDAESFRRWWESEEYRPWSEIRDRAAEMVIVECRDLVSRQEG